MELLVRQSACARRAKQNGDARRKFLPYLQIKSWRARRAKLFANGDLKHWRRHLTVQGDHTRRLIAYTSESTTNEISSSSSAMWCAPE